MKNYFPELDGLRGLAALMVFFSHAIGLLATTELITYLQQSPIRTLWDGAAAVDFFFVLSGFVLALPFVTGRSKLNYLSFAIRRAFRLYPAYWLVIAIALHTFYNPTSMSMLSDWAKSLWLDPITLGIVASHATLLLKTNTHAIDPVVWSLITEMRMSLILPIFIYLLNRTHGLWGQVGLVVGVFAVAMLTDKMMFFPHFALGACLAKNYPYFQTAFANISRSALLGFALVIICLYGNRWIFNLGVEAITQSYLTAVASVLLIVVATGGGQITKILQSKMFNFLGKTSYSFYLLHLPILLVAVSAIYPVTNSLVLAVVIALISAYSLSYCCYHFVEIPAIRLGKFVSGKI